MNILSPELAVNVSVGADDNVLLWLLTTEMKVGSKSDFQNGRHIMEAGTLRRKPGMFMPSFMHLEYC